MDLLDNTERIRQLERENERLQRAVEELSVLNNVTREIAAASDLKEIMSEIIGQSLRSVEGEEGVITLIDEDEQHPAETLVRTMETSSERQPYHIDQNLVGWMHHHRRSLMMNDPRRDDRFSGISWDESIHSVLCVPLMVRSRLIGILTIYNKKDGGSFSEEDQRLLTIIAGQSAQVIENARLYEEEKELLVMQEELRLAYEIQIDLLPDHPPEVEGYDITGRSIPARKVGGDYYDYIWIDEQRIGLCLGDVSGKGLPASLLMANLQASLRGQALWSPSVRTCVERANQLICKSISTGRFITLFYGVLDIKEHAFSFVNAGHNPPLLFKADDHEPRLLTSGGLILGVMNDAAYEEKQIGFSPGDLLVIYSDGITEAMDSGDLQYGEERLEACVTAHRDKPTDTLIERIIDDVGQHTGTRPQADDMTLLAIRRSS